MIMLKKTLTNAWWLIRALTKNKAQHRRGFRLGESSPTEILAAAAKELDELREEPDDILELGDVLSVLIHYGICKGWTEAEIAQAIFTKLAARIEPQLVQQLVPEVRKGENSFNFHTLWTACTGTSRYDKDTWQEIEKQLLAADLIK